MGIGNEGLGPLNFENFSKKIVFLVSSAKNIFTIFGSPLEKFWNGPSGKNVFC